MSARCPHEAERQLRDEPPALAPADDSGPRSRLAWHAEIEREQLQREATDAEVRAAIEAAEERGSR